MNPTFTLTLEADDIALISLGQQALLQKLNSLSARINEQLAEQQKSADLPQPAGK